ncbi:Deleted in malignant brain tumors 1 protein [Holothuria leucospilota]|uniref:Deleted in malignant brain tumors 1 protein n=1 Tax=Holothuria leucospilota TaxID=206669 RepID=A0A9Q1HAT3_HOLLE|nr:Deleted in malignant brain tumors 1 protein [Holothuria leucospilota]
MHPTVLSALVVLLIAIGDVTSTTKQRDGEAQDIVALLAHFEVSQREIEEQIHRNKRYDHGSSDICHVEVRDVLLDEEPLPTVCLQVRRLSDTQDVDRMTLSKPTRFVRMHIKKKNMPFVHGDKLFRDIRLVGGADQLEGRVEVYINNEWGTICDDFWSLSDAAVVCRQLGFKGAFLAAVEARYGAGQGPIHMDNVRCSGNEASITKCPHVSNNDCRHQEDAGVRCITFDIGDIRLTEGNWSAGRVEIYFQHMWRSVCDEDWELSEAVVACRQLGFGNAFHNTNTLSYEAGQQDVPSTGIRCHGNEAILLECPGMSLKFCSYNKYAGVSCYGLPEGQSDVRLSSGNQTAGRVEIYLDNEWGTICDDRWDFIDAVVVCRQLGYKGVFNVFSSNKYGTGEGPIHFDEVACNGNETSVWECTYSRQHDCTHTEDVGVSCAPFVNGNIRLANGNQTAGRVEVFYDGQWGTICDDEWDINDAQNGDVRLSGGSETNGRIEMYQSNKWRSLCYQGWDLNDANVVCRQLGFKTASNATSYTSIKDGGLIFFSDYECEGTEILLSNCSHITTDSCTMEVYAGVDCISYVNGDIRLASGNKTAGRVEVFYNGEWGTVCDDYWDINDARVVCNQLGFQTAYHALTGASFGMGKGPIHFDDVACFGYELTLAECPRSDYPNCGHKEDASVSCKSFDEHFGDIRLVGGSSSSEGRVEVFIDDQWGTICDDFWDLNDATVVCRQLGFKEASLAAVRASFGAGTGPIHLDDVRCTKDEMAITECPHVTNNDCKHEEDAGVRCEPYETGHVRLTDGNETVGRIEVYFDNIWTAVCHDQTWNMQNALVSCRQLGYREAYETNGELAYRRGSEDISTITIYCNGNETMLIECPNMEIAHCSSIYHAGVSCHGLPEETGEVRLIDGSEVAGRLQVYLNESWGSICFNSWDLNDAMVVFRQLGFESALFATSFVSLSNEHGIFSLNNIACAGTELSLLECSHILKNDCEHYVYAGVICMDRSYAPGDVRLSGGNETAGRVEVFYDGQWGTICDDEWDLNDGRVVCRQLGFKTAYRVFTNAAFGLGRGPIHFDNVGCRGYELSLLECSKSGNQNCGHSEDAGVTCKPFVTISTATTATLRVLQEAAEVNSGTPSPYSTNLESNAYTIIRKLTLTHIQGIKFLKALISHVCHPSVPLPSIVLCLLQLNEECGIPPYNDILYTSVCRNFIPEGDTSFNFCIV